MAGQGAPQFFDNFVFICCFKFTKIYVTRKGARLSRGRANPGCCTPGRTGAGLQRRYGGHGRVVRGERAKMRRARAVVRGEHMARRRAGCPRRACEDTAGAGGLSAVSVRRCGGHGRVVRGGRAAMRRAPRRRCPPRRVQRRGRRPRARRQAPPPDTGRRRAPDRANYSCGRSPRAGTGRKCAGYSAPS